MPEVPFAPVHPPDAVQLVAFVELQINCDALPDTTLDGVAVSVSVGAADATATDAVCDAVPPEPEHVKV